MGFLKSLFSGGQRRSKVLEEIHPYHKIRVRIEDVQYQLSDYSAKGLSCDREKSTGAAFPFKDGATVEADFLIFSTKTASTRLKIMWLDQDSFGAKVLDTEAFASFAGTYLTYVKAK
jgi:hypothetical protein